MFLRGERERRASMDIHKPRTKDNMEKQREIRRSRPDGTDTDEFKHLVEFKYISSRKK